MISQDSYTEFAYLYDTFMEDVPYEEWASFFDALLKSYGNDVKDVLDLGCGTGKMTRLLQSKGYNMIGVDVSEDMLCVATEACDDILYINQDMRELALIEQQDAIISCCDCINYLTLDEDVVQTFKCVYKALSAGGLFIFDFNTIYKYETVIGDTTIAENREDCSFIWENFYSPQDHINEYDVTFFTKIDDDEDVFRRFTETHVQRGYTLEEMKKFAQKAGFKYVVALDESTHKEPTSVSERIYLVLRK